MNTGIIMDNNINPYGTSFARLLPMDGLCKSLIKFCVSKGDILKLTYGIDLGNNCVALIITGKNQEEKDIPPFDLPFMFKAVSGDIVIAIDLREYVNNNVHDDMESYNELLACVPRHENLKILCRIAKAMAVMVDGDLGTLPKDNLMTCYVSILATVMNNLVRLTVGDYVALKALLGTHFYLMFNRVNPDDVDTMLLTKTIQTRLKIGSNKEVQNDIKQIILEALIRCNSKPIDQVYSLEGLVQLATAVFSPDIAKFFNVQIINNQLKNLWYGPGKMLAAVSITENIPVLLGLSEAGLGMTSFKSSRLSNLLHKDKSLIDKAEFLKKCELNLKYV